jgi:hypothetical protein
MEKLLREYIRKQINEMFYYLAEAGESGSALGNLQSLQPKVDDQIQNVEDLQSITNQTIDSNNETIKQIELQKKNLELNKKRANQEVSSSVPADPLAPPNTVNALKSINNAKLKNIDKIQQDGVKKSAELKQQNQDLENKLTDMEKLQKTIQTTSKQMNSAPTSSSSSQASMTP